MNRRLSKLALLVVALSACLTLSGCTRPLNLRGDNFQGEFSNWGENNRPVDNSGALYGFSNKAQQIERNLGVR